MRNIWLKNNSNFEKNPVVKKYFSNEEGISYFDYDFCFVQLFSIIISGEDADVFQKFVCSYFAHDNGILDGILNGNIKSLSDYFF